MLFLLRQLGFVDLRRLNENAALRAAPAAFTGDLIGRDDHQKIRLALRHHGAEDALAEAHVAGDRSAALAHPVHFALLHVQAGGEGDIGHDVGGLSTPWPPSPAITTLVGLLLIAPLVFADRARRQQAVAAGNDHGKLRLVQALFESALETLRGPTVGSITCTLRMPSARTRSSKTTLPVLA